LSGGHAQRSSCLMRDMTLSWCAPHPAHVNFWHVRHFALWHMTENQEVVGEKEKEKEKVSFWRKLARSKEASYGV
jgi:hypothetical protein